MSALTVVSDNILELPALIAGAGKPAAQRFLEFFTVNIRNPNTRAAYGRAAGAFLRWCEVRHVAELRRENQASAFGRRKTSSMPRLGGKVGPGGFVEEGGHHL